MANGREYDKPATYEVRVKGNLDPDWSDWFDGFAITVQSDGITVLVGRVSDQPALHGLLVKISNLALPLLSVIRLEDADSPPAGNREFQYPTPIR